jgi:hypothetical protein
MFRLLQDILVADFKFPGALLDLTFERFSESAKAFLTLAKFGLDAFVVGDISR